jgi:hypothetical protein
MSDLFAAEYDVTPDGEHFVMVQGVESGADPDPGRPELVRGAESARALN